MRRLGRSSRLRRSFICTALATLLLSAAVAGAPASAEPRPTIAQVQARVAALNEQAGGAAEAYNAGKIELDAARSAQRGAERSLTLARRAMAGQRGAVGQMAADAYRGGEAGQSSLAVLMTSDDATAIMQKLATLGAIQRQQASTLRRVEAARQSLEQAQAIADQRAAAAESLASELGKRKAAVTDLLEEAQNQLARLTAAERARIEADRQARVRAEAAESARFLAAQQARNAAGAERSPKTPKSTRASKRSAPTSSGSGRAAEAVEAALSRVGKPYKWGGAGPNSFDCSGLIMWAYAQVGVSVPHYTGAIWNGFPRVKSKSDLQPGDALLFYKNLGHAGIYLGGGKMVHAPSTGDVVKISDAFGGREYMGAVRIVG